MCVGGFVAGLPGSRAYAIVGHKWFVSAPMSDGLLTLANTEVRTAMIQLSVCSYLSGLNQVGGT
jgi:alkylation response protein AidB-like acyl-CoA dehydrogenase